MSERINVTVPKAHGYTAGRQRRVPTTRWCPSERQHLVARALAGGPAEALMRYTEHRLRSPDVARTSPVARPRAWIGAAGIIDDSEASAVIAALDTVEHEWATDTFVLHRATRTSTAVERRVTEPPGRRGRSSTPGAANDQVATDLRLWCKREFAEVARRLLVARVLLGAEADQTTYLPGYTHLQRAQPVLLAHHFRSRGRWRDVDACTPRSRVSRVTVGGRRSPGRRCRSTRRSPLPSSASPRRSPTHSAR